LVVPLQLPLEAPVTIETARSCPQWLDQLTHISCFSTHEIQELIVHFLPNMYITVL